MNPYFNCKSLNNSAVNVVTKLECFCFFFKLKTHMCLSIFLPSLQRVSSLRRIRIRLIQHSFSGMRAFAVPFLLPVHSTSTQPYKHALSDTVTDLIVLKSQQQPYYALTVIFPQLLEYTCCFILNYKVNVSEIVKYVGK